MFRLFYTNALRAVRAANKYEALGYVVDMSADDDVITLCIYKTEAVRNVA